MAFHSFDYCVKNREASMQQLDWAKLIGNRSENSLLYWMLKSKKISGSASCEPAGRA